MLTYDFVVMCLSKRKLLRQPNTPRGHKEMLVKCGVGWCHPPSTLALTTPTYRILDTHFKSSNSQMIHYLHLLTVTRIPTQPANTPFIQLNANSLSKHLPCMLQYYLMLNELIDIISPMIIENHELISITKYESDNNFTKGLSISRETAVPSLAVVNQGPMSFKQQEI